MSNKLNNVFSHLDNVTEVNTVRVTSTSPLPTTYTTDNLNLKTKAVLLELAENDFEIVLPIRTNKQDIINHILKAQKDN